MLVLSLLGVTHAAEVEGEEQASLVIAYHVAPASRPTFRHELETSGIRQFQRWKEDGVLNAYRILFSRYADSDNWDAMALLTFPSTAGVERWKVIEKTAPGGLSFKALGLTQFIRTTPVSLARSRSSLGRPVNPVFLVIPYVTLVSTGDYLKYADGYMSPQFDGLIAESVLSHYELFVSTFSAGRPWSSLVILEYEDQNALAQRNIAEAKVRGRLKDSPEWKAFSDAKKSIREEKQVVIAEQISLR